MEAAVRTISHYSSDMDILLVGEGDFSFAAALARAFQHAPRLLATSLDSREMLHFKYGWFIIEPRLVELSLKDVMVLNEVDVTTIVQHPTLCHLSFDRIIYNFPHSGFAFGLAECTQALIEKHQKLMRGFFENARRMLKVGGEVHVAHHMCEPYSRWRLQEEAAKSGLKLRARPKFEVDVFPGYRPRRGAGANANGTFHLRNPVTFIFFLPYSPPPPCIIPPPPPPPPPPHYIIPCTPPPPPCIIPPCPWWQPGACITPPPFPWQPCPYSTIPYPPYIIPCPPILQAPLPSNIINTPPSLPPPPPHPLAINFPSSLPIRTPVSPSMIISPHPPHISPHPSISHQHISHHQQIKSHQNPNKPPPSTFNISFDLDCYQHSNSNHHLISEYFSCISAHVDHLLLYNSYLQ